MKGKTSETASGELSRRGFLKGGAALGAAMVGGAALGATMTAPVPAVAEDGGVPDDCIKKVPITAENHGDLPVSANWFPNAEPIPPEPVPASWDMETDVVVVGMGAGGVAATTRLAEQGVPVIGIEKSASVGGTSRHASAFLSYGGSQLLKEAVGVEPNVQKVVEFAWQVSQHSADMQLLTNLYNKGGECVDWIAGQGQTMFPFLLNEPSTNDFIPDCWTLTPVPTRGENTDGQAIAIDFIYDKGKEYGADYLLSCECEALVQDESGRIVGVKAHQFLEDKTIYVNARKGVILTAGGFTQNFDMLGKYCPTALSVGVNSYAFPGDTGEAGRMGLGVGADWSGFNSFGAEEAGLSEYWAGNGPFHHPYFVGDYGWARLPLLKIDRLGNRIPYIDFSNPLPTGGVTACEVGGAVTASAMDGRYYIICDGNIKETAQKVKQPSGTMSLEYSERHPSDYTDQVADWEVYFDGAIERGTIKRCDTLEELADVLGLDFETMDKAIDRWNEVCAAGKDEDYLYRFGYPAQYLIPIDKEKSPFYGTKCGCMLEATRGGLRVDKDLRVISTEAKPIPGLYAGFATAGGATGENTFCEGLMASSILGSVGLSWTGGYIASETILADNQ